MNPFEALVDVFERIWDFIHGMERLRLLFVVVNTFSLQANGAAASDGGPMFHWFFVGLAASCIMIALLTDPRVKARKSVEAAPEPDELDVLWNEDPIWCTCGSTAEPEPVVVKWRDGTDETVAELCPDCLERRKTLPTPPPGPGAVSPLAKDDDGRYIDAFFLKPKRATDETLAAIRAYWENNDARPGGTMILPAGVEYTPIPPRGPGGGSHHGAGDRPIVWPSKAAYDKRVAELKTYLHEKSDQFESLMLRVEGNARDGFTMSEAEVAALRRVRDDAKALQAEIRRQTYVGAELCECDTEEICSDRSDEPVRTIRTHEPACGYCRQPYHEYEGTHAYRPDVEPQSVRVLGIEHDNVRLEVDGREVLWSLPMYKAFVQNDARPNFILTTPAQVSAKDMARDLSNWRH